MRITKEVHKLAKLMRADFAYNAKKKGIELTHENYEYRLFLSMSLQEIRSTQSRKDADQLAPVTTIWRQGDKAFTERRVFVPVSVLLTQMYHPRSHKERTTKHIERYIVSIGDEMHGKINLKGTKEKGLKFKWHVCVDSVKEAIKNLKERPSTQVRAAQVTKRMIDSLIEGGNHVVSETSVE